MNRISFTVLGKPQPAGSKRAFVNPKTGRAIVVDAAKGSRSWKQEVGHAATEAHTGDLLEGPLTVSLVFFLARPKGHRGANGHVRGAAPMWPAVRPDIDKLSRAVLDGMSGNLYRDDAQIVRKTAVKQYGIPERVEITVLSMIATVAEWDAAHEFSLEPAVSA